MKANFRKFWLTVSQPCNIIRFKNQLYFMLKKVIRPKEIKSLTLKKIRSELCGCCYPYSGFFVNKAMPAILMGPRGLGTTTSQRSLAQHRVTLQGLAAWNTKSFLWVSSTWRRNTDETMLRSMARTQPFAIHPHKGRGCCSFPMHSFDFSKENLEKLDGAGWKSHVLCSWLCVGRSQTQGGTRRRWTVGKPGSTS